MSAVAAPIAVIELSPLSAWLPRRTAVLHFASASGGSTMSAIPAATSESHDPPGLVVDEGPDRARRDYGAHECKCHHDHSGCASLRALGVNRMAPLHVKAPDQDDGTREVCEEPKPRREHINAGIDHADRDGGRPD